LGANIRVKKRSQKRLEREKKKKKKGINSLEGNRERAEYFRVSKGRGSVQKKEAFETASGRQSRRNEICLGQSHRGLVKESDRKGKNEGTEERNVFRRTEPLEEPEGNEEREEGVRKKGATESGDPKKKKE